MSLIWEKQWKQNEVTGKAANFTMVYVEGRHGRLY